MSTLLAGLSVSNELRVRQRAVHGLATVLCAEDSAAAGMIDHLRENSPFAALLELATEAEAVADHLTLSLCFSAVANLAQKLVPIHAAGAGFGQLLGRSIVLSSAASSSADAGAASTLLSCALSAAFNLSADLQVLAALNEAACAPALVELIRTAGRTHLAECQHAALERFSSIIASHPLPLLYPLSTSFSFVQKRFRSGGVRVTRVPPHRHAVFTLRNMRRAAKAASAAARRSEREGRGEGRAGEGRAGEGRGEGSVSAVWTALDSTRKRLSTPKHAGAPKRHSKPALPLALPILPSATSAPTLLPRLHTSAQQQRSADQLAARASYEAPYESLTKHNEAPYYEASYETPALLASPLTKPKYESSPTRTGEDLAVGPASLPSSREQQRVVEQRVGEATARSSQLQSTSPQLLVDDSTRELDVGAADEASGQHSQPCSQPGTRIYSNSSLPALTTSNHTHSHRQSQPQEGGARTPNCLMNPSPSPSPIWAPAIFGATRAVGSRACPGRRGSSRLAHIDHLERLEGAQRRVERARAQVQQARRRIDGLPSAAFDLPGEMTASTVGETHARLQRVRLVDDIFGPPETSR